MSNETIIPIAQFTRECTCGKKGIELDTCMICRAERDKTFNIDDSIFLSALKLQIISAFFNQIHVPGSNGSSGIWIGGQFNQLVADIMKLPQWKELCREIMEEIAGGKEQWMLYARDRVQGALNEEAKNYSKNWDVRDAFKTQMEKVAREYALELLQTDPELKAQIEKAAGPGNYTVSLNVSVNIIKKQEV